MQTQIKLVTKQNSASTQINGIKGTKNFYEEVFLPLTKQVKPPFDFVITLGRRGAYYDGSYTMEAVPSKEEFYELMETVMAEVKEMRHEDRKPKEDEVTRFNGVVKYKRIANAFTSPNALKNVIGKDFKRKLINTHKTPDTKDFYLGLELEMLIMCDTSKLVDMLAEASLHRNVNVGSDGSVRTTPGKGGNAIEMRILVKETELETVMKKVCDILHSKTVSAYANDSCGFHVHVDARNRNAEIVYNNLVAALPLLSSMVPQTRVDGDAAASYCRQNKKADFQKDSTGERYMAVNPTSFNKHKTIEVRLHSGTTNYTKIISWCKILSTLANNPKLEKKIKTVDEFAKINTNETLHKYMKRRVQTFVSARVDTSTDELLDTLLDNGSLAALVNA